MTRDFRSDDLIYVRNFRGFDVISAVDQRQCSEYPEHTVEPPPADGESLASDRRYAPGDNSNAGDDTAHNVHRCEAG